MAFKKKLYQCRPRGQSEPEIETQRTRRYTRKKPCDPASIERGVRQLLADKVQGNLTGLWLLAAEHLRLGTWDLLCGWSGRPTEQIEPRLALQLVYEAAICTSRGESGIAAGKSRRRRRAWTSFMQPNRLDQFDPLPPREISRLPSLKAAAMAWGISASASTT